MPALVCMGPNIRLRFGRASNYWILQRKYFQWHERNLRPTQTLDGPSLKFELFYLGLALLSDPPLYDDGPAYPVLGRRLGPAHLQRAGRFVFAWAGPPFLSHRPRCRIARRAHTPFRLLALAVARTDTPAEERRWFAGVRSREEKVRFFLAGSTAASVHRPLVYPS